MPLPFPLPTFFIFTLPLLCPFSWAKQFLVGVSLGQSKSPLPLLCFGQSKGQRKPRCFVFQIPERHPRSLFVIVSLQLILYSREQKILRPLGVNIKYRYERWVFNFFVVFCHGTGFRHLFQGSTFQGVLHFFGFSACLSDTFMSEFSKTRCIVPDPNIYKISTLFSSNIIIN